MAEYDGIRVVSEVKAKPTADGLDEYGFPVAPVSNALVVKKAPPPPEKDEDDLVLDEFLTEVTLGERDEMVEKIMKAFKLSPFETLQVGYDATPDQVRRKYKKLSLLVHPDKCKHEKAMEAFQRLKVAQETLLDEEKRENYALLVAKATETVDKAREKAAKKRAYDINNLVGRAEEEDPAIYDGQIQSEFRKLLAEVEWRRRQLLKKSSEDDGKKKLHSEKLAQDQLARAEKEQEWEDGREERVGGWRAFSGQQKGKKRARETKAPKLKLVDGGISLGEKGYEVKQVNELAPDYKRTGGISVVKKK